MKRFGKAIGKFIDKFLGLSRDDASMIAVCTGLFGAIIIIFSLMAVPNYWEPHYYKVVTVVNWICGITLLAMLVIPLAVSMIPDFKNNDN